MSRDQALSGSPLLSGLSPDETRQVMDGATSRRVPRGDVLFRQDEPAEALWAVAEGRVKLSQVSAAGQEIVVRLLAPGDVFAAIAVLDGKAYPFTAAATEPSRVVLWPRRRLAGLFRDVPRFERNVLDVVGAHSREMIERFRELATEAVPQRLARALLRLAGARAVGDAESAVLAGITRQDLAQMAGTTLFTVSRILSEWQDRGIVETGRGKVVLRERRALEGLAEGQASRG